MCASLSQSISVTHLSSHHPAQPLYRSLETIAVNSIKHQSSINRCLPGKRSINLRLRFAMTALTESKILLRTKQKTLANVTSLNLWGNELTDISVASQLVNCTVLSLSVNRISSLTPLASCHALTELYLRKNELHAPLDTVIAPLCNLPSLQVLWLSDNPTVTHFVSQVGEASYRLHVLSRLKHLVKLDDRPVSTSERQRATQYAIEHPPSHQSLSSSREQQPMPFDVPIESQSRPPRADRRAVPVESSLSSCAHTRHRQQLRQRHDLADRRTSMHSLCRRRRICTHLRLHSAPSSRTYLCTSLSSLRDETHPACRHPCLTWTLLACHSLSTTVTTAASSIPASIATAAFVDNNPLTSRMTTAIHTRMPSPVHTRLPSPTATHRQIDTRRNDSHAFQQATFDRDRDDMHITQPQPRMVNQLQPQSALVAQYFAPVGSAVESNVNSNSIESHHSGSLQSHSHSHSHSHPLPPPALMQTCHGTRDRSFQRPQSAVKTQAVASNQSTQHNVTTAILSLLDELDQRHLALIERECNNRQHNANAMANGNTQQQSQH